MSIGKRLILGTGKGYITFTFKPKLFSTVIIVFLTWQRCLNRLVVLCLLEQGTDGTDEASYEAQLQVFYSRPLPDVPGASTGQAGLVSSLGFTATHTSPPCLQLSKGRSNITSEIYLISFCSDIKLI